MSRAEHSRIVKRMMRSRVDKTLHAWIFSTLINLLGEDFLVSYVQSRHRPVSDFPQLPIG